MSINFKKYTLLFLFLISFLNITNAKPTANKSLQLVYEKLLKLKDYTAEVNIRSDIPLIKIMPVNAKIFFKQPNQFKMVAKGIAILPKQGFSDLANILKDSNSYLAVLAGNETIDQTATQIIHLIPNNDNNDLIIGKFWVDTKNAIVLKSQLTTKSNGNLLINYQYDATGKAYGLPNHLLFTVDVKKFKIPKAIAADVNKTKSASTLTANQAKTGSIDIRFSNIQINKGINDKVFKK